MVLGMASIGRLNLKKSSIGAKLSSARSSQVNLQHQAIWHHTLVSAAASECKACKNNFAKQTGRRLTIDLSPRATKRLVSFVLCCVLLALADLQMHYNCLQSRLMTL